MYYSKAPITLDQAAQIAPSILANSQHSSRSDNYCYVPTRDILAALTKEGFNIHGVTETAVRNRTRHGFQKHLIRLRKQHNADAEEAPELVLINSHDGSSAFRLIADLIRFACANGLIMGRGWQDVRVKHTGDVLDNVIEGTFAVVDQFDESAEAVDRMKSISLEQPEQEAFARAAIPLRFNVEDVADAPVSLDQVNHSRRRSDTGNDLWSTFNRIQENLIRGNLGTRSKDKYGRIRRSVTKEVKGIDQNVKLNRALFTLAEEMAKLKK